MKRPISAGNPAPAAAQYRQSAPRDCALDMTYTRPRKSRVAFGSQSGRVHVDIGNFGSSEDGGAPKLLKMNSTSRKRSLLECRASGC